MLNDHLLKWVEEYREKNSTIALTKYLEREESNIFKKGIIMYNVKYEVALDVLGQRKNIYVSKYWEEEKKPNPDARVMKFFHMKKKAIDDMMDELETTDHELIELILDKDSYFI